MIFGVEVGCTESDRPRSALVDIRDIFNVLISSTISASPVTNLDYSQDETSKKKDALLKQRFYHWTILWKLSKKYFWLFGKLLSGYLSLLGG
jgi:hypothetical protein